MVWIWWYVFISKSQRIIIIIISLFASFSHQHQLMVVYWILNNNKSPQVSRTLLGILANLNNPVISVLLIFNSSSHLSKPSGTCSKRTNCYAVAPTFYSVFSSLSFHFLLFLFYGWPERQNPQDFNFFSS